MRPMRYLVVAGVVGLRAAAGRERATPKKEGVGLVIGEIHSGPDETSHPKSPPERWSLNHKRREIQCPAARPALR